ncbi:MAG: phosphatidylserine/phosphatidylglycerophosphate/cardiolipin synthase family protein [Planctomycetaceae bacterium]|nr:phosphatidylserine/phosphatidylglycerophosphate/cardiolipin synthase family protein [Planctomycetaceae bacterium]
MACITVLSIGLALAGLGCTAFPMKSQQVWRSLVDYDYPSAPVGSAEFEAALDRYTGSVARPVEKARLLQNGDEAYPAMLEMIEGARESIAFETYIIENDATTDTFFDALKAAAARGVRVRVLVDAAGFHRGFIAHLDELSGTGVDARVFNPFFASWTIVRGNNRDHRKILTVDGRHAILGGINLSDIQRGDGISGWRDTALYVAGPVALDAERVFNQTWQQGGRGWVGKTLPMVSLNPLKQALEEPFLDDDDGSEIRPDEALASASSPAAGKPTVRVIASSPDARNSATYDMAIIGVTGARERLDIAVAYFVPPLGMRRALLDAAGRGVRVRLLLPGVTDVRMVREMGMRFYGELLQAGIEIYEWPHPILHAKTMVADGRWLVVGSANMDSRSYFLNYEACLALSDPKVAGQAHEQFDRDLEHATRVTMESWRARSMKQKILEPLLIPASGQY